MGVRVSFFATCLADTVVPGIAIDSVRLLRRLGCEIRFNPQQTCCGQPLINAGYHREALPAMRHLMEALLADGCDYVVAPSGSCVLQVKEYPRYFRDDPVRYRQAEELAAKIWEITDFVVTVLGVEDVGARLPGRAAYHPSCHMTRLLGVREAPLTLLRHVRDLELVPFAGQDRCCGFGGLFSVKLGELSGAMVAEKAADIAAAEVDYLIGADGGCLLNIQGRLRREGREIRVLHVVQALMQGITKE